jgi:hypothetical protein
LFRPPTADPGLKPFGLFALESHSRETDTRHAMSLHLPTLRSRRLQSFDATKLSAATSVSRAKLSGPAR